MVVAGVVGKEHMLLLAPDTKVGLDVAVPLLGHCIGLGDIEVHLVLAVDTGTYVATAVKIYAHGICLALDLGTFHLYYNILLVLITGKHHLVNGDIGQLIALDILCLYGESALTVHEIAQQLYLERNGHGIWVAHDVLTEVECPLEIGRIAIVEVGTVRTPVEQLRLYLLTGRECECKAQQPDNILNSLFHIVL